MSKVIGKMVLSQKGQEGIECAVLWENENDYGVFYSLQLHTKREEGKYPKMDFARAQELASEIDSDGKRKAWLNFYPAGPKGSRLVVVSEEEDDFEDL